MTQQTNTLQYKNRTHITEGCKMKTKKDTLLNELMHFSPKAWQYQGKTGISNAVRAKRSAGSRCIRFYSVRGYYVGESYGLSVNDVDETVIRSQVFDSKGNHKVGRSGTVKCH